MPYDIDGMRAALQEQISPRFFDEIAGMSIADSFSSMRESDDLLSERSPSICLIPRNDGNGRAIVDCQRKTAGSHSIHRESPTADSDQHRRAKGFRLYGYKHAQKNSP